MYNGLERSASCVRGLPRAAQLPSRLPPQLEYIKLRHWDFSLHPAHRAA